MFETSGKIDEAAFREMSGTFMPRWYKLLCAAISIILILSGVWMAVFGANVGMGVFYSFMGLLVGWSYFHRIRQIIKLNMRRMAENGAPDGCEYMTRFDEDGVYVENRTTQGKGLIGYESLRVLHKTEHYMVLVTKSRQAFYIFRTQLDAAQEVALIEFLKKKPTGIKTWK